MHKNRRVQPLELQKLLDLGLSGKEMATRLGVSPACVSRNLKSLGMGRSQDIVLRAAAKINTNRLNAMARLTRAAELIEKELESIQASLKKAEGAERKDLAQSQLSWIAEERKQITALVDVAKAFYSIEDVKEFSRIVLQVLGEASKELRDEVIKRLREARSTRTVLGADGFGI
jgi:predicted transcriptional regulator